MSQHVFIVMHFGNLQRLSSGSLLLVVIHATIQLSYLGLTTAIGHQDQFADKFKIYQMTNIRSHPIK